MKTSIQSPTGQKPRNKGRLVGQKAPLRPRDIWAIRGKRPPTAPSLGQINPLHYAPDMTGAKRWVRRSRVWTWGWRCRSGGC